MKAIHLAVTLLAAVSASLAAPVNTPSEQAVARDGLLHSVASRFRRNNAAVPAQKPGVGFRKPIRREPRKVNSVADIDGWSPWSWWGK
ncbi:hypothetical protein BC830DRAFT_1105694 [Chytriomyces sp. MP71]|nr:hypothetical protein BC830DRAFT_1105694 [Chytriomyces sp. MP71]